MHSPKKKKRDDAIPQFLMKSVRCVIFFWQNICHNIHGTVYTKGICFFLKILRAVLFSSLLCDSYLRANAPTSFRRSPNVPVPIRKRRPRPTFDIGQKIELIARIDMRKEKAIRVLESGLAGCSHKYIMTMFPKQKLHTREDSAYQSTLLYLGATSLNIANFRGVCMFH